MDVFSCNTNRRRYQVELGDSARRHGLEILAYCWTGNHVHVPAMPREADSMARAIGRAHGR